MIFRCISLQLAPVQYQQYENGSFIQNKQKHSTYTTVNNAFSVESVHCYYWVLSFFKLAVSIYEN